ncbi:MAG: hypothetical protein RLZZ326_293 [Planctomycetota bacterium]|jgi:hypothetical protein
MDRETLETLCQTFAARQFSWPQPAAPVGTDPVPEILRSFRLAEISAAEMESLLGLVTADEEDETTGLVLAGLDAGLDEPPVLIDDFPDFDEIVAAGIIEDEDADALPAGSFQGVVEIRVSSARPGADVRRDRAGG